MKKLIALSLAAASSLVISNAMALPNFITLEAERGTPHFAECYLIGEVGSLLGGSCDYECAIEGPQENSPALTVFFREQKTRGHVQCGENEGRTIPTWLHLATMYGPSEIFDQWNYRVTLMDFQGSEQEGTAFVKNALVPLSVRIKDCS